MNRTLAARPARPSVDAAAHHSVEHSVEHSVDQPGGRFLDPRADRVAGEAAAATAIRLTGRGRLVVLVALTVVVFALISVGRVWAQADASIGAPAGPASSSAVTDTWVVQPGETLWTVAGAIAPDVDPRETIASIVALNALSDTAVVAGQTLLVPA